MSYVRTGPFNNNATPSISAAFLNNIENVLEQPSGGTETGKYQIVGNAYVTSTFFGIYICSISRGATPISVTIDTADAAPPGGTAAPSTGNLTSNGFKIYTSANQTNNSAFGGNWTINY